MLTLRAPYDGYVEHVVHNETELNGSTPFMTYINKDKVRIIVDIPPQYSDFGRFNLELSLDGKPYTGFKVEGAPLGYDKKSRHLSILITVDPSDPHAIKPGDQPSVSLKIFSPNQARANHKLGQPSQVMPRELFTEEYTAPIKGQGGEFYVKVGDEVKEDQPMFEFDHKDLDREYQTKSDELQGVTAEYNRLAPDNGNQKVENADLLTLWNKRVELTRDLLKIKAKIELTIIRAKKPGRVEWIAQGETQAFEKSAPVVRVREGLVYIGELTNPGRRKM